MGIYVYLCLSPLHAQMAGVISMKFGKGVADTLERVREELSINARYNYYKLSS